MPDAVPTIKKSLLDLAREKFGELTPAEVVVCEKTEAGEIADMSPGVENFALKRPKDISISCAIRSEILRFICTDKNAVSQVTYRGVQLCGVYVLGQLDMLHANVDFPLLFCGCKFASDILVHKCSFEALYFSGSSVESIYADNISVRYSMCMNCGFEVSGCVSLIGAAVGGDLNCKDASFFNRRQNSLVADRIEVKGDVSLDNKFVSFGSVRFVEAVIGGSVIMSGGKFLSKNVAIVADGISVGHSMYLNRGFKSLGEVRLMGAKFGGNVECDRGKFYNIDRNALNMELIRVDGAVMCRDEFSVKGIVTLASGFVGTNFCYSNVVNPLDIKLNFDSAKIGFLCDEAKSWPRQGNLILHGLVYDNIAADCAVTLSERIDWLSRQKEMGIGGNSSSEEGFSAQPHEQLASVYLKNGHYNHARKILFDKNEQIKNFKSRLKNRGLKSIDCSEWLYDEFHSLLGATVGYGYAPHRAFLWVGLIVFLGAFIFTAAYAFGLMTPAQQWPFEPGNPRWKETYPGFNPLLYSVEVFLPVIDFGLEKYWTPNTQAGFPIHLVGDYIISFGGLVRLYLWFHIIAGWTLITLFLGSISGFIRR